MNDALRNELREKAPLVEPDELKQLIVREIVDDKLREWAAGVWLLGSFVNPGRDIDSKDKRSDLDAFVLVPDWEFPQAGSGMAMFAEAVDEEVPTIFEQVTDGKSWSPMEGPESVLWECSVDEAWEQLPACVQRSLVNSTQTGVYAIEEDKRNGRARCCDLIVGNEAQLEFNRAVEEANGAELIDTQIWSPDEGRPDSNDP